MDFSGFLETLLNEGRVRLACADLPDDEDRQKMARVLGEFEQRYRLECPGQPPAVSLPAAVWAAEMFHGAALALAYREIDETAIAEILSRPFPANAGASGHYSVDLTFRLLPELHARAKAVSRSDPLVEYMEQWAKEWPLSSVGIRGVVPDHLDEILANNSLLAIYIDRIIEKKDLSRLHHPDVSNAVRAAYGIHDQLAPEIHAAITAFPSKANP